MLNQSELKVDHPYRAAGSPQNFLSHLATALGIQPGEGLPTLLLFAQAFFLGVMLISFYTAANALFLLEFGAKAIPYLYIVTGGVVTLAGVVFSRLEQRISFRLLLMGTFVFLLLSVLLLRLGLWLSPAPWLLFTLMVWLRLIWTLSNLGVWALAGRLFNVRQGKRLFSLIMAGAVFSMIMTGLLSNWLIALLGVPNLLLVTVAALAMMLLFLWLTLKKFHNQLTIPTEGKEKEPLSIGGQWRWLLKKRYIVLIFLYMAFSTLGSYVLDFTFTREVSSQYTSLDALAGFFGNYIGVSTLVLLFLSLGAGTLLTRYGLKFGLIANPVLVAIGAGLIVILGTFGGETSTLFWLVVLTKLCDDVLLVPITTTSIRILYQALPTEQQVPVQAAAESIITPLFIGLVGLLLIFFGLWENFSTLYAVYLLLFFLTLWTVAGALLNSEYGVALKEALTKRSLRGGSLISIDRSSIHLLEEALSSPHLGVVLYSLKMLEENKPDLLPTILPELLEHPVPEVRQDVLHRIERLRLTSLLPAIKKRLNYESSWAVQGASLRTLAALGNRERHAAQDIYSYLEHPEPEVQLGTIVGLLRSGEIEAILAAGEKLIQLISSPSPTARTFGAQVLGEGGIPFVAPLLRLLQDDEREVQRAALIAAGKLKHPQLWPAVTGLLAKPKVRAAAVRALISGGEAVLEHLKPLFPSFLGTSLGFSTDLSQEGQRQELLIRLAQICARIRGTQAIALLEQQLDFPDEQVRFHILVALNQCGYQAQDEKLAFIRQAIKDDLAHISWILTVLNELGEQELLSPLKTALRSHLATYRTRLFLWLSFIYQPQLIGQLEDNLAQAEKKVYALELLESLLSTELSALLIPFFDDDSKALLAHFPQQSLDCPQRLSQIIKASQQRLDAWTRACALYIVPQVEISDDLTEAVLAALSAPEPLVRETALWTACKLAPVASQLYLEQLQHDPARMVQKAVRHLRQRAGKPIMLSQVEKIIALKRSPFFAKAKERILAQVAATLQEVEAKAGEIIFAQDDIGDCMYLIYSGQVKLGDRVRTFEELGAGGAFGELALLDPAPRSGQATANSDSRLLRLDAEPFYELIADHTEVARGIMQVLAQRLRRSSIQSSARQSPRAH